MIDEKIIKKVIEKALKQDWNVLNKYNFKSTKWYNGKKAKAHAIQYLIKTYHKWIFSHEFAKAYWGKEWEHHLEFMVLEDEPLKYLEKFL